jgi:hypothetical protein
MKNISGGKKCIYVSVEHFYFKDAIVMQYSLSFSFSEQKCSISIAGNARAWRRLAEEFPLLAWPQQTRLAKANLLKLGQKSNSQWAKY